MIRCLICNQSYSRRDALQRHERNVHGSGKYTDQSQPLKEMTFRHPFSMMITGPSGLGKTEWTRKLLLSSLVQPPPERILWCFGQWQPLYEPDICNRRVSDLSPPGKQRKLRDERSKLDIWNRRFQNPIRQENVEQFKAKVNAYEERGFSSDKAIHLAANDDLPSLRKKLRRDYAQFLIDYYELQEDPVQQ